MTAPALADELWSVSRTAQYLGVPLAILGCCAVDI